MKTIDDIEEPVFKEQSIRHIKEVEQEIEKKLQAYQEVWNMGMQEWEIQLRKSLSNPDSQCWLRGLRIRRNEILSDTQRKVLLMRKHYEALVQNPSREPWRTWLWELRSYSGSLDIALAKDPGPSEFLRLVFECPNPDLERVGRGKKK